MDFDNDKRVHFEVKLLFIIGKFIRANQKSLKPARECRKFVFIPLLEVFTKIAKIFVIYQSLFSAIRVQDGNYSPVIICITRIRILGCECYESPL